MEDLEFAVESIQLPELKSNFEKFKAELVLAVEQFKIEVTEDNIQEAKKMMASLNKIKANISEKGKETVAIFKKPADSFREQIKELENICDISRADIALQVYRFEEATKVECERLVLKLFADLRGDYKIESRFYSAKHDDLIKLSFITANGGLTKACKEGIQARIQKEQLNQNLYYGRLKEVEAECLKAGITPFTETSVAHILTLDYDDFKLRLITNIQADRIRTEEIQHKADEKAINKAIAESKQFVPVMENKPIAPWVIEHDNPNEVYTAPARSESDEERNKRYAEMNEAIAQRVAKEKAEREQQERDKIQRIRPSSLPRIFSCTNSRHAPEISIEEKFAGNAEGIALHKFSEKYFTSENTDIRAIIGEVEDQYKVDIAYLCWNLSKLLLKYRSSLKNIESEKKIEVQISSGTLSGTMDLVGWIDDTKAVIIDAKAGFGGNDYTAQLKGYALAMFKKYPLLQKVGIITAYASTSKIKTEAYTREDSLKFESELFEIFSGRKNRYNVGDNCTYCPLRYECTAKQGVLNGTVQDLFEENNGIINVEILEKVNLIEKAVKKFKELFKQKVEAEGEVRIGINTYYISKDVKEKLVLTPESFEYLHSIFGSQMTKFLSISETELKELKMSEAPKGLKIAEWRAFFEELNKKGFTEKIVAERLSKK